MMAKTPAKKKKGKAKKAVASKRNTVRQVPRKKNVPPIAQVVPMPPPGMPPLLSAPPGGPQGAPPSAEEIMALLSGMQGAPVPQTPYQ